MRLILTFVCALSIGFAGAVYAQGQDQALGADEVSSSLSHATVVSVPDGQSNLCELNDVGDSNDVGYSDDAHEIVQRGSCTSDLQCYLPQNCGFTGGICRGGFCGCF